jgi:hypothetical protein
MAKDNKIEVVNKDGARIRMNAAAFEIAEKHFGVTRSFPAIKETPVELLKLPNKVEVIKAVPKEDKTPEEIPQAPAPETPVKRTRSKK